MLAYLQMSRNAKKDVHAEVRLHPRVLGAILGWKSHAIRMD